MKNRFSKGKMNGDICLLIIDLYIYIYIFFLRGGEVERTEKKRWNERDGTRWDVEEKRTFLRDREEVEE